MKTINFRIHLIYTADGMRRPLSFRQVVPAYTVTEALKMVASFIGSAYISGFKVVTWTAENVDLPVEVKYVGGEFAKEVTRGQTEEPVHSNTEQREDTQDRSSRR